MDRQQPTPKNHERQYKSDLPVIKKTFRCILVFGIILLMGTCLSKLAAQIVIQSTASPGEMVKKVVGEDLIYGSIQYGGADLASAIFENGYSTNLGLDEGIILCTGDVNYIPGPNDDCDISTVFNTPAGPLAWQLTTAPAASDGAILLFSVVPETDTIRFRYVFASDQYSNWVFDSISDAFGCYLTGPDPDGGDYYQKNIALVPGTNHSIQIATINNGPAECFTPPAGPCVNCQYFVDNSNGTTLEYNGLTTVLEAKAPVIPCHTYYLIFEIADGNYPGAFDSAVFIEAGDYQSPQMQISIGPFLPDTIVNLYEGCDATDLILKLPSPEFAPLTVNLNFTGSTANPAAYPAGDFEEEIPGQVTFEEGQDSIAIHIQPVNDGIAENIENLKIKIIYTLTCIVKNETVNINIHDYYDLAVQTSPDTTICTGEQAQLWVNVENGKPPYSYQWEGLPFTNDTIAVTPITSTWYYVTIFDQCQDTVTDSIHVEVLPPLEALLVADTVICQGEQVNVWENVENGLPPYSFTWPGFPSTNDTLTVTPNTSGWYYVQVADQCQDTVTDSIYIEVLNPAAAVELGNDTTVCTGDEITLQPEQATYNTYSWSTGDTTASITVSQPGTYSLDVTSQCGESSDEITIDQWPTPDPDLGPDLQLCFGETAFLQATTGFDSYTWQDNSTDDFFIVTQGGLYFVNVEDIHGCTGSDSVIVLQGNNVQLQADSLDLCLGDSINIQANPGFYTYTWSTGQTGTDNITVDQGGWYKVDVAYVYGCPSEDSLFVDEFPKPEAAITGEDMFCEGDTAWLYAPEGKYDYSWNDEPGTSNYMVTQSGNYILKLSNVCGESTDEKYVQMNALPTVDLGEDIILMPGESVKLDAGTYPSVIWNHDSTQTGQYYTISYDDLTNQIDSVFVEVFDGFCKNSDNIVIELFDIEVPIVITPNGNGRNDLFKPGEGWNGITSHHITVFNRWGQPVWESDDFASGWDGKQNGKYVADGTYYWILEINFDSKNIKKTYKGSLTVLGGGG